MWNSGSISTTEPNNCDEHNVLVTSQTQKCIHDDDEDNERKETADKIVLYSNQCACESTRSVLRGCAIQGGTITFCLWALSTWT